MGQALGCHCLPWCLEKELPFNNISLRDVVLRSEVRCNTKTKDNVFVTVAASVRYGGSSEKAAASGNELVGLSRVIQDYVIAKISAIVPTLNLDTVLEQKNDIAKVMEDELGKAILAHGYEIVQILIVSIEPDVHVKRDGRLQNQATTNRVRNETK